MRGITLFVVLSCLVAVTLAQSTHLDLVSGTATFAVTYNNNQTTWTLNSNPYYVTGSLGCTPGSSPLYNSGTWSCGTFNGFGSGASTADTLGCTDGQTPTYLGSAWTCQPPSDLLAALSACGAGSIPKLSQAGTPQTWICGADNNALSGLGCTTGQILGGGAGLTCLSSPDQNTLAGLSCANGETVKWTGSAWACAADVNTIGSLACSLGQIPRFIGSSWVCGTDNDELARLNCTVGQTIVWSGSAFVCSDPPSPTSGSPIAFIDGQELGTTSGLTQSNIGTFFGTFNLVNRKQVPIQIAGGFNVTSVSILLENSASYSFYTVQFYRVVNTTSTLLDSLTINSPATTASKTLTISIGANEALNILYSYSSSAVKTITTTVIARHFIQ